MIKLQREKDNKWIFQKNISSKELIESYLKVLDKIKKTDKSKILKLLKDTKKYKGRSIYGSINTMGVRFSQMCFYMFGYKNSNSYFIPTQSTINLITNTNEINKNMLVNLFAIQFPHPYSKTSTEFKIFAGRLFLKLLSEIKIDKKLYIDEIIFFLPFIKTINENIYIELIESILEFRKLSYNEKIKLFKSISNYENIFANCLHEINYYFLKIFNAFNVIDIFEDKSHNEGKLLKFRHGNTSTFRSDSAKPRSKFSGYVKINCSLDREVDNLLNNFSLFEIPTSLSDVNVYSKENWISDLYESEFLNYLSVVFPEYNRYSDIINYLTKMTHLSKFSSKDGKEFENSLKPVFELFREALNVEIISGAGNTDLLCTMEDYRNNNFYKINVDAKSGTSSSQINAPRISRHLDINYSKYCIIVAPRFAKAPILDISNFKIVAINADALSAYCGKECLSSKDGMASFEHINKIIEENLGKDITFLIKKFIEDNYGF